MRSAHSRRSPTRKEVHRDRTHQRERDRAPLPEEAFRVFTQDMGTWWPVGDFSRAADQDERQVKTEQVVVEPWQGGRIFETMSDESEGSWGTMLLWSLRIDW